MQIKSYQRKVFTFYFRAHIFTLVFFLLPLIACSNSECVVDSFDRWDYAEPCTENDEIFNREDSTYYKCVKGKWQINTEEWTQIPITGRFLPIEQGKFIPNATFNTPFALQPPQPLHNGSVRCTFDGSEPNSSTPVISQNQIIDTTTVVRCTEFVGEVAIQKQTETYFINESIHMPVVSISVAPDYVSEYLDAEPCKPHPCKNAKFWEDVEFPAHIEYFENGNSSKEKAFEIDAGISIAGNWSRNQQKKSVAVIMRNEYQKGRINYPLFDTRPQNKVFKAFILRNNGQRFANDYIGDALATSLLEGTTVDYQRSKQVVVFYNGQYRGIYDMREKINEHFFETNYNLDSKSINLIKHEANAIHLQSGSATNYFNMLQFISNNDFKENSQAYDSVLKMIDITNYMEYMASEIYFRNGDWPHTNVRAWSHNNNPWKFVLYDVDQGLDWGWGKDFPPEFNRILNGGQKDGICATNPDYKCFHNIFKKLVQNSKFKQKFINRSAYLYSTFINQNQVIKKLI